MPDPQDPPTIPDVVVASVFAAYPEPARERLLELRALILETAAVTQGVGRIGETLKWGQPSYLTTETRSGSTVRIDTVRNDPSRIAIFFNCQTDLVATFRGLYPDVLVDVEGNRALRFGVDKALPRAELAHCVALALTHHARRKSGAMTG